MADRDNIIRMAREVEAESAVGESLGKTIAADWLKRFADRVIADFLQRTGQYLTNDASRDAVIADAVAEEREACAQACSSQAERWGTAAPSDSVRPFVATECEKAIRARGQHG